MVVLGAGAVSYEHGNPAGLGVGSCRNADLVQSGLNWLGRSLGLENRGRLLNQKLQLRTTAGLTCRVVVRAARTIISSDSLFDYDLILHYAK